MSIALRLTSLPMFSFTQLFEAAKESVGQIGGAFISLLGLVMIVVAGWQIGKGLISPQKAQTNWFMVIGLLIVGGLFLVGGIGILGIVANNMGDAVQGLGNGQAINQILPYIMC